MPEVLRFTQHDRLAILLEYAPKERRFYEPGMDSGSGDFLSPSLGEREVLDRRLLPALGFSPVVPLAQTWL